RQFTENWRESTAALGWGLFRGLHTCEFCRRVRMFGNFGVPAGNVLYVAPEMVGHYIEAHSYLPPAELLAAVLVAPVPGTDDYSASVQTFRRRHLRREAQSSRPPRPRKS